jgi:hypothetical protein
MSETLRDFLQKFAIVYIDDVCIYNRTLEEHMEHLLRVLQRFKEEGHKLRFKNFFFGLQEMEYHGCTISGEKLSVSRKKVEAVKEYWCLRRIVNLAVAYSFGVFTLSTFITSVICQRR